MQCSCISFAFLSLRNTVILKESNTKPMIVCVEIIIDISGCIVNSKESIHLTVFSIFLLHLSTESLASNESSLYITFSCPYYTPANEVCEWYTGISLSVGRAVRRSVCPQNLVRTIPPTVSVQFA